VIEQKKGYHMSHVVALLFERASCRGARSATDQADKSI